MSPFIYYVYFDRVGRPEKISCKNFEDFKIMLDQMVYRAGEMPEWIQRVYK